MFAHEDALTQGLRDLLDRQDKGSNSRSKIFLSLRDGLDDSNQVSPSRLA